MLSKELLHVNVCLTNPTLTTRKLGFDSGLHFQEVSKSPGKSLFRP